MLKQFIALVLLAFYFNSEAQITVSGTITDRESGEQLLFVSIYDEGTGIGTVSNEYGFFSLTIPTDSAFINIEFLGYAIKSFEVNKNNLNDLDFSLKKESTEIEVVELNFKRTPQEEIHNSTQMSTIKISIKDIRNIPSGAEADIIKVIQLMPGVQKGGEGGTGIYVRGGDVDQNAVLLDEANIYNIGHLFGFFSVFNQDAIKDMTLYKGAFPSTYGGRLSSVLDIKMKEGNNNKIHAKGGVGLLSSRLMIEAPIKKNRGSFMIAGRRTYIDQVFKWAGSLLPYYFYDLNAKLNYKINEKNHIYFSTYIGNDVLNFQQSDIEENGLFNFGFTLGNVTGSIRWNRIINDKTFANYALFSSKFDYNINGNVEGNSLYISSAINDYGAKFDYQYFKSKQHTLKYGGTGVYHQFRPNVINSQGGEIEDILESDKGDILGTFETGIYFQDVYKPDSSKWEFRLGLRISSVTVKDKMFAGIEPRISGKYNINANSNLKFSYSHMRQYMHLVSSSTVALPTDLWYPVTENVKPQTSHQVATGYSYFVKNIKTHISIEAYYKYMTNLTEYKEGANLFLNSNFQEDLLQGSGDSYGMELLVKKDEGIWNGWIGYTLSWSNRYFDELNNGDPFYAKYDRRHNFSIVQNLKLSKRWSIGAVWVFSTGSKFTPQVGLYAIPNASATGVNWIPQYAKRNSVSMSATHRLDVNFVWKSRSSKKFKSEWHFGAYNLYHRASPMRIEIAKEENGDYKYVQPGLFGFVPSIAYNFEF